MPKRLRIGILGLGRRWPRFRRALLALAEEMRPVAVHDIDAERAEREARDLGAESVGGVVELIERPDVDALLLASTAWHALWPLEQAARAGKPILLAVSPGEDDVRPKLADAKTVHVAPWPALTVLRETIADRLQESIGRPLFVQINRTQRQETPTGPGVLSSPVTPVLLRECADLFGSAPDKVTIQETTRLATVMLRFPHGAAAQFTLWSGPAARSSCRVQVEAENGAAWAELPRLVEWADGEGRHRHELPTGLAEVVILDRFAEAARGDGPGLCSFARACEPLDWLGAARQSR